MTAIVRLIEQVLGGSQSTRHLEKLSIDHEAAATNPRAAFFFADGAALCILDSSRKQIYRVSTKLPSRQLPALAERMNYALGKGGSDYEDHLAGQVFLWGRPAQKASREVDPSTALKAIMDGIAIDEPAFSNESERSGWQSAALAYANFARKVIFAHRLGVTG